MKKSTFLLSILSVFLFDSYSQQLMINEVSQGTSGSQEYVEFVVVGAPICEGDPIPCIDIRRVIFDDNNGFFASGGSVGIASGALRFSGDDFWSCIPQGTIIVIYNDQDPNSSLPPDDSSITDGNCTIVLPGNSSLLETANNNPITPNPTTMTYPTLDSEWIPSITWSSNGMRNAGDSFQIPNLGINGTPLHSVSWGDNSTGTIIYFSGSASGRVFNFKNTVSSDYNDQQNWLSEDASTAQTPGLPNSPENDYWIATMNPTCRVLPLLSVSSTSADCGVSDGTATVSADGIVGSFIIDWSNGGNTATISNLDGGIYTVEVTDQIGCTYQSSVSVNDNNAPTVTATVVDEGCINSCNGSISLVVSGGTAPLTTVWSPNVVNFTDVLASNLCSDQYTVSVTDANGCMFSVIETVSATTDMVLSFVTTQSTCGASTGSATVNVAGGSGNYSFLWGASAGNQATQTASSLPAGTHQVTITDLTTSCQQIGSITINNSNGLTTSIVSTPLTCLGACNASASVSVSGGTGIYSFLWDSNAGNQTNATAINLCVGNYSCTISDNAGCTAVETVTVTNPVPVTFTSTTGNTSCDDVCDGDIQVSPNGGMAPYTILIFDETGAQKFDFSNLCEGNYSVLVGDVLGCSSNTQIVSISSSNPIDYVKSPDQQLCFGDSIKIGIQVTAGSPSILWSTSSTNDSIDINPILYTEYSFTLTQGACSKNDVIKISVIDCTIPPVDSSEVTLPNIFTPNGDNKNDFFVPLTFYNITVESFVILNRWGNLMVEFNDANIKWDGKTTSGKDANEGTYFYKFTYKDITGSSKEEHGFFQLVRD